MSIIRDRAEVYALVHARLPSSVLRFQRPESRSADRRGNRLELDNVKHQVNGDDSTPKFGEEEFSCVTVTVCCTKMDKVRLQIQQRNAAYIRCFQAIIVGITKTTPVTEPTRSREYLYDWVHIERTMAGSRFYS